MGLKIGVLALQGDFAEHSKALVGVGAEPVEVRTPEQLDGCAGLILPGGESTAMSLLIRSAGLEQPMRELIEAGLPVFGTCAGMILLASRISDGREDQLSFGAIDISVRRNGFGRQIRSFESDLSVRGVDGPAVRAVFIRAPVVEEVFGDAEVLASVEYTFDGKGSLRVPVVCAQGSILVTSFHPELTVDLRIHEMFMVMIERSN